MRAAGRHIKIAIVIVARVGPQATSETLPIPTGIDVEFEIQRLTGRALDVVNGDVNIRIDQSELVGGKNCRIVGHHDIRSEAVIGSPCIHR